MVDLAENSTLVTGGASGLGRATAEALVSRGAFVTIVDLPTSSSQEVAGKLGSRARFAAADVRSTEQLNEALDLAERSGPLRAVVHCAGRGARVRVIEKDGEPGSLETYEEIIKLNLIGSFNVLRLAAVRMARAEPIESERGVCVLTASVAAWEGQIGQIPYASSKAGIVGMTLVAARDLASKLIRVATIAPGVMDTPILDRIRPDVKEALEASVPHPRRLGRPEEFADLALAIIGNPYLNGETIRLDGAIRMAPR
jgi:NAD(P)-dependent dehydrogenase (short-subunit alcohol dehydrogenase family)